MGIFRPEVYDSKRRKLWGEVRIGHPPSLRTWIIVTCSVCVILAIALVTVEYTRKETARGFFTAQGGTVEVRAVQAGRVSRVLVREGQTVSKGEPLVELIYDIGSMATGPVLDLQIAESVRQADSVDARRHAQDLGYESEKRRLENQVSSQVELGRLLQRQRETQRDAVQLAELEAQRIEELQNRGFASAIEVDRRRRTVLAERSALTDLDRALAANDGQVQELKMQIDAIPARKAESVASLAGESARLAQTIAELEVARGHVLTAPTSGTVTRVAAREGMTPSGSISLVSIAPEGAALQARILVPTDSIGFLSEGQEARLQVDAFPFERFGMITGRITYIHPNVVRPGDAAFPVDHTQPIYEVEVAIDRSYVDAYGSRRSIRPGMSLTADIPLEKKKLWNQLFDPISAARGRLN